MTWGSWGSPSQAQGMRTGHLGTVIYLLVLWQTLAYLLVVVAHAVGRTAIFGSHWAADGFCLSFKGTLFQSHLLSFYCDTLWAVILFALPTAGRLELGIVKQQSAAVLFHGLAHLMLWWFGDLSSGSLKGSTKAVFVVGGLYVFYFMFLKPHLPARLAHAQSAMHALISTFVVPPVYLFTYVNTVLSFNMIVVHLVRDPRDRYFDLLSIASAAIMAMTWFEPLACDRFLIDWGGHLW